MPITNNSYNTRSGEMVYTISAEEGAEEFKLAVTPKDRNRNQLLAGLDSVIKSSAVIVQAYTVKLPSTVATLSEIVLTLKANSGSLSEAITSLAKFSDVAVEKIWDKKRHLVTVRLELSAIVRAWLR